MTKVVMFWQMVAAGVNVPRVVRCDAVEMRCEGETGWVSVKCGGVWEVCEMDGCGRVHVVDVPRCLVLDYGDGVETMGRRTTERQ